MILKYRRRNVLPKWMRSVLRFGGWYNVFAGLAMATLYPQGFYLLGLPVPEVALPIQLAGVLVSVFGVGYLLVDKNPIENRNIMLLGLLSKSIGPLFAFFYIAMGMLPPVMIPILFFADLIYLIPFWMIWKRIGEYADAGQITMLQGVKGSKEPIKRRNKRAA